MLVDWLPWNHTFGGNHNVGIVLYNGGTLYIDEGKPTPAHPRDAAQPARDLAHGLSTCPRASRRSPTRWKTDDALRDSCSRASRPSCSSPARARRQPVWDKLDRPRRKDRAASASAWSPAWHDRDRAVVAPSPSTGRGGSGHIGRRRRAWNSSWCPVATRPRCASAARTSRRATGARREQTHEPSTKKASTADRRRGRRSIRPTRPRACLRRPHRRGLQARPPAPSSTSAAARTQDHRCRRPLVREDVVVAG